MICKVLSANTVSPRGSHIGRTADNLLSLNLQIVKAKLKFMLGREPHLWQHRELGGPVRDDGDDQRSDFWKQPPFPVQAALQGAVPRVRGACDMHKVLPCHHFRRNPCTETPLCLR